jgi:NhaA family Na+:H+ antiporter
LYASGIHPTLAGIALALIIPSRTFLPPEGFVEHGHLRLDQFRAAQDARAHSPDASEHLNCLDAGIALVQSPLDRMEMLFHPWVSYGIMPAFALANAGIPLRGTHLASALQPAFLGTALGLLFGKPLGITLFSWLAVRLRIAELPKGVSWLQLHAVSWVAGIGFTVAIFIAGLAFRNEALYTQSRIAIVIGSVCAAAIGAALLNFASIRSNACDRELSPAGNQN